VIADTGWTAYPLTETDAKSFLGERRRSF